MAGEITTESDLDIGGGQGRAGAQGFQGFFQDIISDPQKRIYAIIAAVILVVLLITVTVMISKGGTNENRGNLVPLVQNIDQARAFEIVAKLKSVNIDAKIDSGERPGVFVVKVYEKAVETSYLALARTNLLEDDDYGLFDQNDWAASDYDKRIKLSRAINGDLSRIISRMDGLKSAIVRVNVPEQEIFTEMQAPTTATVQVELLNDGDELGKSQVKSIVNLLRGYVPNLDKEKISIVDTQGRNYNTFREEDDSEADDYIEEIEKMNKLIKKRVTKYLDVVLGNKNYEVSVSALVSREKVEEQQTTYKEGAVGARQTDQETLKAGGAGAGPGASSSSKDYNSQSTNETLLPSYEQKSTTYLPGRISKVTVALAVDKSVPAMISLSQLRESIAAVVGPQTSVEDVKLSVVDLRGSNDDMKPLAAAKGTIMQNIAKFFHGGIWSAISKIFTVIAIVIGLLLVAIISLNFLSVAANKNSYVPELDPNLSNDFDQIVNDEPDLVQDYGESAALAQQEALLKEMMSGGAIPPSTSINKGQASSYSTDSREETGQQEKLEFDGLLNNFQNVADSKPDILAKKIQMWLEEDG